MASLNFKGKNIIWNHHLSVPYHTLEEDKKLSFKPEQANGNLLIEGDNLLALKALLPTHANKIDLIYIDPPYNTGTESWTYNDKVNSPLLNEWFHKEVSKDDLTKHDKWLCMMTPRLKILRELLTDNGLIFISIDDNEYSNLKLLLDLIFGSDNFIATLIRKTRDGGGAMSKHIATNHDYILFYAKDYEKLENLFVPYNKNYEDRYKHSDENGRYFWDTFVRRRIGNNNIYVIEAPDGTKLEDKWNLTKERFESLLEKGDIKFTKNKDKWSVQFKQRMSEGKKCPSIIENSTNDLGTKEIVALFNKRVFEYPKPTSLITLLLSLSNKKDLNILDSFAGSGTTAQAVMELNAKDGGNRKFILVQMTEATNKEPNKNICKDITRERIVRVIKKHSQGQQKFNNYFETVGFEYKRVGIPIDAESMLSGQLPSYEELAKYVFYLAFGKTPETTKTIDEKSFYVGNVGDTHLYLIYKQDLESLKQMALNLETAETINKKHKGRKVVYAPACFLDDEYLQKFNIQFVSIPYNLFETGNGK